MDEPEAISPTHAEEPEDHDPDDDYEPIRRRRKTDPTKLILKWAAIGAAASAALGLVLSQFAPCFGGFLGQLARPFSQARIELIPVHVLVFGLVGGLLAAGVAALKVFTADQGRPSAAERNDRSVPTRPSRRRGKNRWSWVRLAAIGGGMLLIIIVAVNVFSSSSRTDNWTYKEMHSHLVSKGCKWVYRPHGTETFLLDVDEKNYGEISVMLTRAERGSIFPWPEGAVEMDQMQTPEDARQRVGRTNMPAFNYHRWYFVGDKAMIDKIRKALK